MRRAAAGLAALVVLLAACAITVEDPATQAAPVYSGGYASLMAGDILRVSVAMGGAATPDQLRTYADCAAVDEALFRGFAFARHVSTTLTEEAGLRQANAFYSLSTTLPRGIAPLDAATQAETCRELGIPRV
ncbi:MAG: hypothetical protein AAF771_14805 [Pseudomonadota bacterium]